MLKIYHSQGARSLRVLWLCEEMGVPYETAEASFFKPSDEFKAVNPLRTVPAMIDGDVRMIESVAMMIYIMSKYGPTDLEVKPDEPGYAELSAIPAVRRSRRRRLRQSPRRHALHGARGPEAELDRRLSEERDPQAPRIRRAIASAAKPIVAADRFTAADISVTYIVTGAKFAGIEDDIPAGVKAYVDNLWQRPAFQRAAAVK